MAKVILRQEITHGVAAELPESAKIIHFGFQEARKAWSVWYEVVDETRIIEHRMFMIYPTGATVPDQCEHIASHIMQDGFHIFHLYEAK